jgi:hypothetical protein
MTDTAHESSASTQLLGGRSLEEQMAEEWGYGPSRYEEAARRATCPPDVPSCRAPVSGCQERSRSSRRPAFSPGGIEP